MEERWGSRQRRFDAKAKRKKKKGARSNRERRVRPTFPSGRTGPLSGDRRIAVFGSRRTPRRAVASDARPFRARERRDRRGRKRHAPVRASVRLARARACRSTAPKYRSTTDFPLQTSNRGPRKRQRERGRARAERRHRSAASERAPARRIARRHSRARAVGRGRASRASRGPARGRMARRYATREGSSAQIPAMSRVCRIATRARASIAPAAPRRAERALRGIRERDAPL